VLGDRYAIYGFSGMTRKRCELYRIKRFDEPYSELVQQRIAGIQPKDYTRMGVTIRHLTKLLHEVEARTKLLITSRTASRMITTATAATTASRTHARR